MDNDDSVRFSHRDSCEVSPEAYWAAYTAVCENIGRDAYNSEEHFLTAVGDWARIQQRYLNYLVRQDSANNSNN